MEIIIQPSTAGRWGGSLKGNLTHFNKLVEHELKQAGFTATFDRLHVTFTYPPLYVLGGTKGIELDFKKYYDALPHSRLNRKEGRIEVSVQAPEFSEHFDKQEQKKHKIKFEASPEYRNLPEATLAQHILDKLKAVLMLLKPKMKKGDAFDFAAFEKALGVLKDKISPDLLSASFEKYSRQSEGKRLAYAEQARHDRKGKDLPKDKLIRDIRLYYDYELPASMFYLGRFADVVLAELIKLDFRCPVYHHLYISIASTREQALKRAIIAEDWYTFGIAVLPKDKLFAAGADEQQALVLNAIRDGLMDIATLDDLDTDKILDAVQAARETGVLTERIFKAKENNKIIFAISTKTIAGANKEEIYFTLIDKQNDRTARWKFGEENIFIIGGWFGTITVTNKIVRTKPRAHMDLVLKGKQMNLEIDVEKTFANPGNAIKM